MSRTTFTDVDTGIVYVLKGNTFVPKSQIKSKPKRTPKQYNNNKKIKLFDLPDGVKLKTTQLDKEEKEYREKGLNTGRRTTDNIPLDPNARQANITKLKRDTDWVERVKYDIALRKASTQSMNLSPIEKRRFLASLGQKVHPAKTISTKEELQESLKTFLPSLPINVKEEDDDEKINVVTYLTTGTIEDGTTYEAPYKKPPGVYIYCDRSGSFTADKVKKELEVINGTIAKLESEGKIYSRTFYFSDDVVEDINDSCLGGGTSLAPVIKHIQTHRPDNVIIFTDRDFDSSRNAVDRHATVVPGCVWFLFVGSESTFVQAKIYGLKHENQVFMLD